MESFLEKLYKTAALYPTRPAVVDRDGTRVTTYQELLTAAGRINAWLRKKNLGREDVIAIYFPKSMEYIAARIGIMMAGCAWVGLEDLMGKERIQYVIHDSGSKAVINEKIWSEAMQLTPCETIAAADPHDLAFIIYTSGSTGTPKGAAHEYGVYPNIARGTYAFLGDYASPEPLQFASVAPQTFIAGIYTTIGILDVRGTIHEISMSMVRDIASLSQYFIEKGIQDTFMTPTFIRLLLQDPRIQLRACSTGGEIVSDVFTDRFDILNVYGPSDFGFPTCVYRLDRAWKNTPIGYPVCGSDIVLLDEEGLASNEGTLCISLPYFRGYVGETDESCTITLDGKKYLRSSDYVHRDEDGKYTVLDRLDDMVKLNGNRVDTREVEAAVKRVLGLDFCCVRLYRINGIKALCAYYTGDQETDSAAAAQILREHLPEYMIPAFYIRLPEVPVNANGKVDKRALPEPKGLLRISPFAAPEDETQQRLCDVLQSLLDPEGKVGIDDDFFMLGGDSILAMEALARCDIPGLTVQLVYEGRTVRNITSLLCRARQTPAETEEAPDLVPLNAEQMIMLREDLRTPGTCMLNLPVRFHIRQGTDMEKLAAGVRAAVRAHPALMSVIEEKEGGMVLRCLPERTLSFPVEKMNDGEMEAAAAGFVRPFRLDGEPLFRCRLIQGDSENMLLLDVYHVICDGFSLKKLIEDIFAAFAGEAPAKDAYFALMREEAENRRSPRFREDQAYFKNLYGRLGWDKNPTPDHDTEENLEGRFFIPFDFTPEDTYSVGEKFGLGKNGLYVAATALTMAAFNDSEKVMFTWVWHGRSDGRRMNAVGYLLRELPVAVHLKRGMQLSRLYETISAQIRDGVSHGSLSYWAENDACAGEAYPTDLLYQGDLFEYHRDGDIVTGMELLSAADIACNNSLNIEILDGREAFGVLLGYNARKYERQSMERFGSMFRTICALMIGRNPNTTTVGDILLQAAKEAEHHDR